MSLHVQAWRERTHLRLPRKKFMHGIKDSVQAHITLKPYRSITSRTDYPVSQVYKTPKSANSLHKCRLWFLTCHRRSHPMVRVRANEKPMMRKPAGPRPRHPSNKDKDKAAIARESVSRSCLYSPFNRPSTAMSISCACSTNTRGHDEILPTRLCHG